MVRFVRRGALPDKHLMQIRMRRDRDAALYQWIESLEVGDLSGAVRDVLSALIKDGFLVPGSTTIVHVPLQGRGPVTVPVPATEVVPRPQPVERIPAMPFKSAASAPLRSPPEVNDRLLAMYEADDA